jgi:hypothetical protein
VNLKREGAIATPSGRVATWERRKVKLWEEPDHKLVTDDVRGGRHSFWAEWQLCRRAHPSFGGSPQIGVMFLLLRLRIVTPLSNPQR